MSQEGPKKCQVVVIGAGVSGLSAAKWLLESGVNVLVIEARDRVGGRTYTRKDPKLNYVDLGGAYVGPTQNHILRMAKELGVETYKVNEEQPLVYYHESGYRKLYSSNCSMPTFWNPFLNLDINNFFRLIDKLGSEIPPEAPWNAPHAEEWDRMTVKEFGEKYLWTKLTKELLRDFINLNVASGAYEASLLWFLWYIRQCGGVKRIFSTTNGGQERKFFGGSQQISEKIAAKLEGRVHLKKPVVGVEQNGEVVTIKTLDGSTYLADYVIFALAPSMHMKIHFDPPLPPIRNQFVQRVPIGSAIKCNIYYKRAFWRENGLCGGSFIQGAGDDYPLTYTLDDTKPDGSYPSIIGFITADKARRLAVRSPEERKVLIAKSLEKVFASKEALDPIYYVDCNWLAEQYSGGCYTAMYPPGCFTQFGKIMREPFGRIFFAGTETAIKWSGYMEGAVSAGERAAREVLHRYGKITQDQIWREEPESKEVPALPFHTSFYEKYAPSVSCVVGLLKWSTLLAVLGTGAVYARKHLQMIEWLVSYDDEEETISIIKRKDFVRLGSFRTT